jgi:hypothetical protein
MSNLMIQEVTDFPVIQRSRSNEDLIKIINCLHESAATGKVYSIQNVEPGNAYNSMQQRIRTQSKKHGYRVAISFDKTNNVLYFKAALPASRKVSTKELQEAEMDQEVQAATPKSRSSK